MLRPIAILRVFPRVRPDRRLSRFDRPYDWCEGRSEVEGLGVCPLLGHLATSGAFIQTTGPTASGCLPLPSYHQNSPPGAHPRCQDRPTTFGMP